MERDRRGNGQITRSKSIELGRALHATRSATCCLNCFGILLGLSVYKSTLGPKTVTIKVPDAQVSELEIRRVTRRRQRSLTRARMAEDFPNTTQMPASAVPVPEIDMPNMM